MLYGRSAEQAALHELLTAARAGRSGALVLRGEAGIGKSALLGWSAEAAHGLGLRVLRVTGVEREAELAFAGLVQLLWPVQDRLDALPEPQAAALRAVLGSGRLRGEDRFLTGLAVLTLLADLAERGPVLCLVDDAQWLDQATAEALLFAARRLAAEGVAMVFATRQEGFAAPGFAELRLGRLAERDAARVLAGRTLAPGLRERIIAESSGNPLALIEFASEQGGCPPGMATGAEPLPVADRVLASFHARIAELPEGARLMALLVAAEGRGELTALLRAAHTLGIGLDDLEHAEGAGLLRVSGDTVGFGHPLIATAAYQGASLARRIAAHQALADAVEDPDARAHHLSAATTVPGEGVAAELASAAGRARDRTAYASAARLFQRAAQLSPDREHRALLLGQAAAAALSAGHAEQAADLATRAAPLTGDPARLAALARVQSVVEFERGEPGRAADLLVEHAAHSDLDEATAMLRTAASYAWFSGRPDPIRLAAERLRVMGRPDDAVQGMAHLIGGDYARGMPLLAAHVEQARKAARHGDDSARMQAVYSSVIIGDDEATLDLTAAEIEHCRRQGLIGRLPKVLQAQAQAQTKAGLHRDATAAVAEAAAIARDTGLRRRAEELDVVLASIAAIEGQEERCRELTRKAVDSSRVAADCALSLLEVGLGRHEPALRRLESAWLGPGRHTSVLMAATADQIEAAVRLGRSDRAAEPLRRFHAWAEGGRRPWALAVAARCQALVDGDEESYLLALGHHAEGGRPFEHARTNLLYGEWLRRSRRPSDAREPLRSALGIFDRLNAAPWSGRARTELRATGEPVPAVRAETAHALDTLTPQELQVVRLAAEGRSSREIGARLFLSPRTIEHHLYKAYPKLGVRSRAELARLDLGLVQHTEQSDNGQRAE